MGEIQFRQSCADFPMTVKLGDKAPSWGLARWNGNSVLRFAPPDDEGFTLRGDTQRLVYKGRRRSHRFTILGDSAFEYDCILEREPDSNVIPLRMEGAEYFDFFRQPDFVKDPYLKGSYAVYKKETLPGEGTGKLCHIHRPEIIDARGRRCWGELSIVGDCLCITIPEKWLSEAVYPMIVDPTIGTTTIGSQIPVYGTQTWNAILSAEFGINQFVAAENISGQCKAHLYLSQTIGRNGDLTPVLFDDENGKPQYRRSKNEKMMDGSMYYYNSKNEYVMYDSHWRTTDFEVIDSVQAGDHFWFGGYGEGFKPCFDYGGIFYKNIPEMFWYREPDEYYDEDEGEWLFDEGEGYELPDFPNDGYERSYNFMLSWYFECESSSKNYVRTITQGVSLSDSSKLQAGYIRQAAETVKADTAVTRFETFFRSCIMVVHNTMAINHLPVFIRKVTEHIKVSIAKHESRSLFRKCVDEVKAVSKTDRIQDLLRNIIDSSTGIDTLSHSVLIVRSVDDGVKVSHTIKHIGEFFRILSEISESNTETTRTGEYYRFNAETAQAQDTVIRGLLFFVRLTTTLFIRDYLLSRFLKAKPEIVLKSCISREIILDSKIN